MTAPTYADAIAAQTSDAIRDDVLLPAIEAQGADVAGWPAIAPQRGLVEGSASALAYEQTVRAQIAKTKSPADCIEAGSTWVDARLAWFRLSDGAGGYGRIQATRAVWDVPLKVTAAAAPLTIGPTTQIVIQSDDGAYFEAAQPSAITLNSGTSYKGTVRFQARAPGTGGNVSASSFSAVVSGPAGLSFDTTPTQVTSGRDQETDAEYVARGLARWGSQGVAWTLAAFDYWIPLAAPTVTRWRVLDDNPYGPGTVGVILANATSYATPTEIDAVEELLNSRSVRALGSGRLGVLPAVVDALAITIELQGDGTNSSLADDAKAAVEALCTAFPLGPATLDDNIVRAVALGGRFDSIAIDIGGGETTTITPSLPGFGGAVSIVSCSLAAPRDVPSSNVLVATVTVTVAP